MIEKQGELIPMPRGEKVLASLKSFRDEMAQERTKACDTITKKKEEIEFLDKEIEKVDAAIRIVREDIPGLTTSIEKSKKKE